MPALTPEKSVRAAGAAPKDLRYMVKFEDQDPLVCLRKLTKVWGETKQYEHWLDIRTEWGWEHDGSTINLRCFGKRRHPRLAPVVLWQEWACVGGLEPRR